jgi:drug/metabolite transporter (DMT)-like permease
VTAAVLTGPAEWTLVGLATGPLFATAGAWWRDPRRARRVIALCLLGGVFVAEGTYLLASHRPSAEALLVSVAGVLVPLVLGRSARDRLYGCMGLVPAAVAGFCGYLILDAVMDVAFTRTG